MSSHLLGPGFIRTADKDLPDGWTAKQLSEVAAVRQGGRLGLTKEADHVSSGVPAFSAAGCDGFVASVEYSGIDAVILSAIGANCGRCFFASGDWTTLANVQAIIPSSELDAKYLYYRAGLEGYWERSGSAQPFIKSSNIGRNWIAFPQSGIEQRRIASILTSLDNTIEATEALIEKHEQIKSGLMQDLFARGISSSGALHVDGGTFGSHGKRLGVLPTGWNVLPLQKCLGEGASNGIYKPPHLIGRGTLLIGQTALTEDRSVDSSLARRAVATQEEIRRFGLAAGDILVARVFATVEGVGRPALVPELGEPAVFESNMMRLRVAESIIRPRLMFEWLKSDASRRYIEGRANASNQVSVNQGVLYPLPVPVPPSDEQDRMVACIEAADRARAAEMRTLQKLRMQKQGMMQDLLTGKVRVSTPKTEAIA